MKKIKRVVVIGVDAATLGYLTKFSRTGIMPHVGNLINDGFSTKSFSSPPAGTAMNWATISTGAHVGAHGVTAMAMHEPGDPFDKLKSGFFSNYCRAERLWESAERAGKKVILLKYPGSWPSTLSNGIQVEGFSDPDWNTLAIAPCLIHSTRTLGSCRGMTGPPSYALPWSNKLEPMPAKNWANLKQLLNSNALPPLEIMVKIRPTGGRLEVVLSGLLQGTRQTGYQILRLFENDNRDARGPHFLLKKGTWSQWFRKKFFTDKCGVVEGTFRCKLIDLSSDGKDIHLYSSQVFPTTGWTVPDNVGSKLLEKVGPFQEVCYLHALYARGWIDDTTLFEEMQYQSRWLGQAAKYLLSNAEWDMFITQCHWVDHMGHVYLGGTDPRCITYSSRREKLCREMMEKTYGLVDDFVGDIICQLDMSETLIVLTSDHGMLPVRSEIPPVNDILAQEGLLTYKRELMDSFFPLQTTGVKVIDWSKTKAAEVQGDYVYVNLKGREPHGIVEPRQRARVVDKIIEALLDYRNPETGDRVIALALPREEAAFMGLSGSGVGDVVYFARGQQSRPLSKINPIEQDTGQIWFTGNHHGYLHSVQFEEEQWTMLAATVFCGPNIRKGVSNKEIIHLVDIAPTISYLLGIPTPNRSEGRILWEAIDR